MCKLFAYINHETKPIPNYLGTKINKALKHLFYVNSYGQVDGSGLMWMNKTGQTDFIKAPLPSPTFMDLKCFDKIKNCMADKKFVAGHTRYSTVGGNNWENSHPFEFGNFLGIQNGTISNSHKTLVYSELSPCDVDSASVFWAFNKQGVKTTLDRYEGEGVFMFMNKEEKSFNVVKNSYRTLYQAKIETIDAYILATDKFVLEMVAERSGLTLENIGPVINDNLISFTMDNKVKLSSMKVPPPVMKSYNSYNYGGYSGYNSFKGNKTTNNANAGKSTGSVFQSKSKEITVVDKEPEPKKSQTELESVYLRDLDNYYVMDCDCCSDPIYSKSAMYADDPDLLRSQYVVCASCEDEFAEHLGQKLHPVTTL